MPDLSKHSIGYYCLSRCVFEIHICLGSIGWPTLQLNFDINPGRQIQLHQGIDGFGRGLIDIDDAAVGARFKMLPRVFVDVGRSQETINAPLGGQRNRSDRSGAGAVCRVHDLFARGVKQASIEGFESNANFLLLDSCHRFNC